MSDNTDPNGCKDKLQTLLIKAQDAAKQDDQNVRLAASDAFTQFMIESTPNNAFILGLDDIAGQAASALLTVNIEDRLKDIAACNGTSGLSTGHEAKAKIQTMSSRGFRTQLSWFFPRCSVA